MNEHDVSLTELKAKIGNAVLLATTRDCRFVVTRYGTAMGAVIGHKDLQRLKRLDEAGKQSAPGAPSAGGTAKAEDAETEFVDRILLGEEVQPATPAEWELYFDVRHSLYKARFDEETRRLVEEVTADAERRRTRSAAA
jgi:hypothetical protein